MALIGNNADTLLHGLSAFWHRFFRDIGDIQATYEGTEILLGQVYLNFMSDVLNTSLVETPLFRKEYYKLITVREDQLVFKEHGDNIPIPPLPTFYGNPGTNRYVYTSDTFFGGIPQLQDVIFAPKASLSEGIDYRVAGGEIQFKVDPTDPISPGYAHRRVVVGIGGQFTSVDAPNWEALGVEKGDTLYYSESINLGTLVPTSPLFADARKATVVQVAGDRLSVSSDTPFPTFPVGAEPTGFSWRVIRQRDDGLYNPTLPGAPLLPTAAAPFTSGQILYTETLEVSEVSFWAVDAKVDDLAIYNTYGYFFTNKQLSTETYRSLIRGLMQLYILGPAMARLESALNLSAGLPTIREEGEILQTFNNGVLASGTSGFIDILNVFSVPTAIFSTNSVGGYIRITASNYANNIGTFNIIKYVSPTEVMLKPITIFGVDPLDPMAWTYTKDSKQVVTTDRGTYEYPLDTPIRTDVTNPTNFEVLTFKAFEPLTTALRVTDYISDPQWWHQITIPQELMPDTPAARRSVNPQLYPNILGPVGNANVGDPGFYIGRDEDGHTVSEPFRHNAAFILMDRFLKLHMFGVLVDPSVSLTGLLVTDLQKILKDVKPVHTALYFRPITSFHDVIDLTDTITIHMVLRKLETMGIIDNQLFVGSPWLIGDTWKFASAVGGTIATNPMSGGVYVAIGGADPLIQPADPTNIPPGSPPEFNLFDRPLYVRSYLATNTLLTGLGAYWKMNSDSLDSLGVSNGVLDTDFSYTGGSFLGNPTGEPHIDLPNNAALDIYGDVSISVWINSGSGSPGYPYYNNNPIITYVNNLAGTGAYYLRTNPSGIIAFGPDSPGPILMTGNVFAADVWNHIVATRSGTTAKIYVNAVEVASGTVGAGASASGGLVQKIGATGVSEDIANRLKELGLWNRALTPAEITALYAGGAGLSYPF